MFLLFILSFLFFRPVIRMNILRFDKCYAILMMMTKWQDYFCTIVEKVIYLQ